MATSLLPVEVQERALPGLEAVRRQLELLADDPALRSSKRCVAFLRYIVEQTLAGSAEQLKERTIGVDVFGRDPSYDTSDDHIVRTAATELRKRLAIYYGQKGHQSELRIALLPGSYVPHFSRPPSQTEKVPDATVAAEVAHGPAVPDLPADVANRSARTGWLSGHRTTVGIAAVLALAGIAALAGVTLDRPTPRARFWGPVLRSSAPVLIAVGDVPQGPPVLSPASAPDMPPSPSQAAAEPPRVPFADTVTIARITALLSGGGKQVLIRRETLSSFSDLRQGPAVLVGAFNNEWSLRLTRSLRFSLAMDGTKRVIYIRDREHPENRDWSWSIDRHQEDPNKVSGASLHDYALISRLTNSATGQTVVIIGGLYTYGTQSAGEFLADPQLMSLAKQIPLDDTKTNLQLVLETDVTQQTPGPPRVLAYAEN